MTSFSSLIRLVERQLCRVWLSLQKLQDYALGSILQNAYALREKMLHFLQSYQHCKLKEKKKKREKKKKKKRKSTDTFVRVDILFEVIEKQWQLFWERISAASSSSSSSKEKNCVDSLLRNLHDFLDTCLKECMLTDVKLVKVK